MTTYKQHQILQTCANKYQCYYWTEGGEKPHWHATGPEHVSIAAAKRWINEESE